MNKLLKQYGLFSDMQYYDMIAESFINGQYRQALSLFKALPRKNRVKLVRFATIGGWSSGLTNQNIDSLFELI